MIGISSNQNINNSSLTNTTTSPSLNSISNNTNCNSTNNATTNGNNSSLNMSQLSYNLISLSTTLQQFETIRKWLTKHHKKYCENDVPSNKSLSQFLCQFIQFQEDHLGKNSPKPLPSITRLPFEVLVDFQTSGALCHLFSTVFKYKYEQKM
jgi:hypothetical protein